MAAKLEAVVHAAGLVIFERREVGQGRGLGLVEDGLGEGLQGAPAGPFCIALRTALCQADLMEITVTKPIEQFIQQQLTKGYADASEVARQAFLRWMEEEEFAGDPPRLAAKLEEARQGTFRPHNPARYDALASSLHEDAG